MSRPKVALKDRVAAQLRVYQMLAFSMILQTTLPRKDVRDALQELVDEGLVERRLLDTSDKIVYVWKGPAFSSVL